MIAGSTRYLLEGEPDPRELRREVATEQHGAVCTFLGTSRCHSGGQRVLELRYEAYPDMADGVIAEILAEVPVRFGGAIATARHRIGDCPLGEASVAVVVASSHRPEAFSACRYVIDEIKKRAPIWKQEVYEDGTAWVGDPEHQASPPAEGKDST